MCCSDLSLLTVGIEAVDSELDLGEDATGGIQLALSCRRLYHLRNVGKEGSRRGRGWTEGVVSNA